ncbi:MAG: tetraacyldisaccharide 4'-kinase [Halieaceae bacterium]|jgi:tetraacyldisaccharide 4'-kinase
MAVERSWYQPARALLLLLPLEWLFIAVTGIRRLAYRRGWLRRHRLACAVVVVGNISVGGTGKTPAVIALAEAISARGIRVGVVSRGYGGNARGPRLVSPDCAADEVGDEALLIARRTGLPVCIGRDRVAAGRALLQQHSLQLIISDDGLQHYALERDVEVVTTDVRGAFGNGHRLPVGPLRESPARLRSVDLILQRGGADPRTAMRYEPTGFRALRGGEVRQLSAPGFGPEVHAVAGIGKPDGFFALLCSLGLEPLEHRFPDHHSYSSEDFLPLTDRPLIMTAKDAVKCAFLTRDDAWVLEIEAQLPEDAVERVLQATGLSGSCAA